MVKLKRVQLSAEQRLCRDHIFVQYIAKSSNGGYTLKKA